MEANGHSLSSYRMLPQLRFGTYRGTRNVVKLTRCVARSHRIHDAEAATLTEIPQLSIMGFCVKRTLARWAVTNKSLEAPAEHTLCCHLVERMFFARRKSILRKRPRAFGRGELIEFLRTCEHARLTRSLHTASNSRSPVSPAELALEGKTRLIQTHRGHYASGRAV